MGLLAAGAASGLATPALVELLSDPAGAATPAKGGDGVVELGRRYLRTRPEEANVDRLRAGVPGLDPARAVRGQLPAVVPTATADFAAGRTVVVDGWLLAVAEARAAAAVALGA
jgi:hypothetical protein